MGGDEPPPRPAGGHALPPLDSVAEPPRIPRRPRIRFAARRPEPQGGIRRRRSEPKPRALAGRKNAPDLMLGFQYLMVDEGESLSPEAGMDAWMVEVGVTLPIWRGSVNSAVDEADARRVAAPRRLPRESANRCRDHGRPRLCERGREVTALYADAITRAESSLAALRASYETGRGELGECSRRSARSARRAWRAPGPAPIWPSPRPTSPARPENRSPKEKRQRRPLHFFHGAPRPRPFASVSSRRSSSERSRVGSRAVAAASAMPARARSAASRAGGAAIYHCPMHPTYTSDRPGDCLICNMRLVRIGSDDPHVPSYDTMPAGPIRLDPRSRAMRRSPSPPKGARASAFAWRAEQGLQTRTIRTVGRVEADESRIHHVHRVRRLGPPRVRGHDRADRARRPTAPPPYIARSSSPPRRSTSPRAGSARAAGRPPNPPAAASSSLVSTRSRSARSKPSASAPTEVDLKAHGGGVVVEKRVVDGMRVMPGEELYDAADLSQVWSRPRCTSTSCCWSRRARRRP